METTLFDAKKHGFQTFREKAINNMSDSTFDLMVDEYIEAKVQWNQIKIALSRVGFGATMLSGFESVVAPIKHINWRYP